MNDSDFEKWFGLASAIKGNDVDEISDALGQCRDLLLSESGTKETLYLRKAKESASDPARKASTVLHVRFADYALTRSIDTVISYVSYERAREATDDRMLNNEIAKQVDECSSHIGRYRQKLTIPTVDAPEDHAGQSPEERDRAVEKKFIDGLLDDMELQRNFRAKYRKFVQSQAPSRRRVVTAPTGTASSPARAPAGEPAKPPVKFDIENTITQLVILVMAAQILARHWTNKLDELTDDRDSEIAALAPPPTAGAGHVPLPTDPARDIIARWKPDIDEATEKAEEFKNWELTFAAALQMVNEAGDRLKALKEVVDNDSMRDKMADYVGPIANRLNRSPLFRMAGLYAVFLLIGLGILGLVYAFGNLVWPFFGWPAAAQIVVLLIVAAIATYFTRDPVTKGAVEKQRENFRQYIESILAMNARAKKATDILEKLGGYLSVPPDQTVRATSTVRELKFKGVKKVKSSWPLRIVVGAVAAAVSGVVAMAPTYLSGVFFHLMAPQVSGLIPTAEATVVRRVDVREVCLVAEGRMVWQDTASVYVVSDGGNPWGPTIIAKSDATEIRSSGDQPGIEPCKTREPGPVVVIEPGGSDVPSTNSSVMFMTVPVSVPVEVEVPVSGGETTTVAMNFIDFHSFAYVDGEKINTDGPEPAKYRYVVLPLSRAPVEGIDYAATEDALVAIHQFYLGQKPNAPNYAAAHKDVVDGVAPIKAALGETVLLTGCTIDIDVAGYASPWPFPADPDMSNYYLAEGRRAAVLKELQDQFVIPGGTGGGLRLIEFGLRKPPGFEWSPRFGGYGAMVESLEAWYGTKLTTQATEPVPPGLQRYKESIARSVVLAISEESLAACRSAGTTTQTAKATSTN